MSNHELLYLNLNNQPKLLKDCNDFGYEELLKVAKHKIKATQAGVEYASLKFLQQYCVIKSAMCGDLFFAGDPRDYKQLSALKSSYRFSLIRRQNIENINQEAIKDVCIQKYIKIWGNRPACVLDDYDYQPNLTSKLDQLSPETLNRESFYEIVLWKTNRFPEISDELIASLRSLSAIKSKAHRQSEACLRALLQTKGIQLPMASTILRFINPNSFQIIDDRAYRRVLEFATDMPNKYPPKPTMVTESYLARSVELYFRYLDELHKICSDTLPFKLADRILYQLDKKLDNRIGD